MLKEFVEKIAALSQATAFPSSPRTRFLTVYDKPVYYAPAEEAPPLAKTMEVSTLASLAGFVKENADALNLGTHVLHVESPGRVVLRSALETYHRRREEPVAAVFKSPVASLDPDGAWFELADAVILLMTCFTAQGQRDELLGVLRSITTDKTDLREDTGLGQKVTVMQGVAIKGTGSVPNPCLLAPFRTFAEVDGQPESLFVVRLKEGPHGPQVLLKPADGGAWKVRAVAKVADALAFCFGEDEHPAIIY